MSDSEKEISKFDDDDYNDNEAGNGDDGRVHAEQSGEFGIGKFRKAKKVVMFPFANANKKFLFHRKNQQKQKQQEENERVSFASANAGPGAIGCHFCLKQPPVLESLAESFTSDPNDSSFTSGMLKSLLEKNDFYCKECNPHLG